jgi:hypothetical protein
MSNEDFSILIQNAKAHGYKVSSNEETLIATRKMFGQAFK